MVESKVSQTAWAILNPEDLTVSIVANPPKGRLAIPMDRVRDHDERGNYYEDLYSPVYFGTIYTLHAGTRPAHDRTAFKLVSPDPWMLAIAAVVWEGLLQGLAWDMVKAAALGVLDRLRKKGLAPGGSSVTENRTKSGSLSIGFHYERYSEGEGVEKFLIGLRHTYEWSSQISRIAAVRPEEYERLREDHFKESLNKPKPKRRTRRSR